MEGAGTTPAPAAVPPTAATLGTTAAGGTTATGAASVCQFCGLPGHKTRRAKACLHHEPSERAAGAAAAAAAPAAPAAPAPKWTFEQEADEYTIMDLEDAIDFVEKQRFDKHVNQICENAPMVVKRTCGESYDVNQPAKKRLPLFETMGEGVFGLMYTWLRKTGNDKGIPKIEVWEFYSFLAILIGADLINLPMQDCIGILTQRVSAKLPNLATVPVLDKERFGEIRGCLTTIDPDRAQNTSTTWGSKIDDVAQMREFEKGVYAKARRMLGTIWLCFALDDELVAMRSKTLQSRSLSNRKAGKDGLSNNAIADAFLNCILGIRHKVRCGYKQLNTVQELIDELLDAVKGPGMILTADRGYSSLALWQFLTSRDTAFVMVCKKGKAGGCPFILKSEQDKGKKDTSGMSEEYRMLWEKLQDLKERAAQEAAETDAAEQVEAAADEAAVEAEDGAEPAAEVAGTPQGDDGPPPPEDQEPDPSLSVPGKIVDDSPLLGRQIRVATAKFPSSRQNEANEVEVVCTTARTYNSSSNKNTTVIRLVSAGTGVE